MFFFRWEIVAFDILCYVLVQELVWQVLWGNTNSKAKLIDFNRDKQPLPLSN
jgi:hypothetical protein